jgi:threonine dehydrogenase-like Zn-dependent dehydrogenase
MFALWLENQNSAVRQVPVPTPPAGEALVRVLQAGLCKTDIELTRGYYPYSGIIGHEFVGVVESEGEWRGQRVCGEINAAPPGCDCPPCKRGDRTHCERRTVLGIVNRHGAFAEYLTLPFANLHAVPDSIPDDEALFTEPLAAAFEILEQVAFGPGQTVYVVGDGKLGLLCAQALALTGCALTAIGKHPEKLALLARRGLRTTTLADLPTQRADVVVECTGNPKGFELARSLTRPRGTLVLKSTYAGNLTVDMSRLVVDEVTVIGSRCGPFERALRALADGEVEVTSLIHARYPLREAAAALAHAQRPGVLKVLLEIGR